MRLEDGCACGGSHTAGCPSALPGGWSSWGVLWEVPGMFWKPPFKLETLETLGGGFLVLRAVCCYYEPRQLKGGIWELQPGRAGAEAQVCESLEMATTTSAVWVGRLSWCILILQALGAWKLMLVLWKKLMAVIASAEHLRLNKLNKQLVCEPVRLFFCVTSPVLMLNFRAIFIRWGRDKSLILE